MTAQVEQAQAAVAQWNAKGSPRLAELEALMTRADFSAEERRKVKLLEQAIQAGGYDAGAHESARQAELSARASEAQYRTLEKARTAVEGLRRELQTLAQSKENAQEEAGAQSIQLSSLQKKLAQQQAALPDLPALQAQLG